MAGPSTVSPPLRAPLAGPPRRRPQGVAAATSRQAQRARAGTTVVAAAASPRGRRPLLSAASPGLTALCLSPGVGVGGKPRDGGGIGEGRFIFLISALTKGDPRPFSASSCGSLAPFPRLRAALGGRGVTVGALPALPPALATTPILTVNRPAGVGASGRVGERGGD